MCVNHCAQVLSWPVSCSQACLDDVKASGYNREGEEWRWLVQSREFFTLNHPSPLQPTSIVALLKAIGHTQGMTEVKEVFDDAVSRGLANDRVFGAMLAQCVHHKDIDTGKAVLNMMDRTGIAHSDSIQALTRRLFAREAAPKRPPSAVLPDSVDVTAFCRDAIASTDDLSRVVQQLLLEHREGKAIAVLEACLSNRFVSVSLLTPHPLPPLLLSSGTMLTLT
jgi:hypothetical protein